MKRDSKFIFFLLLVCIFICSPESYGRKTGYKLDVPPTDTVEQKMATGSFMVASQCEDCNKGYTLSQLSIFGFDKPLKSKIETFFIRNNTDRTLTGLTFYITYKTMKGTMLHKKYYRLSCNIPPGETRMAEIPAWDKQKSFVYHKSTLPKTQCTPFDVEFDLISYYLRF